MRTIISYKDNVILKSARVSSLLGEVIRKNIIDYQNWLAEGGIGSVNTKVSFKEGIITFSQTRLAKRRFSNYKILLQSFQKLKYDYFGLDSNPNNFLGKKIPTYVDFFPFLVKDKNVLVEQFSYPLKEVYSRYFTVENIIVTYLVRLFKEDGREAFSALRYVSKILLDNFLSILPREKLRLLNAILLYKESKLESFSFYYSQSKRYTSISKKDENKLKLLLERV